MRAYISPKLISNERRFFGYRSYIYSNYSVSYIKGHSNQNDHTILALYGKESNTWTV